MPLVTKVTRHGNSSGVILDESILQQVGSEPGTEVKVEGDADAREFDAAADRVFKRHAKSLERLAK